MVAESQFAMEKHNGLIVIRATFPRVALICWIPPRGATVPNADGNYFFGDKTNDKSSPKLYYGWDKP